MKQCLSHPANDALLVLRAWQIEFCDGDHCAAALMSLFEYRHNCKLDNLEQLDDVRPDLTDADKHNHLLQWYTAEQLQAQILGLYGKNTILKARGLLKEKGVISEHACPNPKFVNIDKKIYYKFHPEILQAFLNTYEPSSFKSKQRESSSFKNKQSSFKSKRSITKNTNLEKDNDLMSPLPQRPGEDLPEESKKPKYSEADHKAAAWLVSKVENTLGKPFKQQKSKIEKWADEIRIFCAQENVTHKEICTVFLFANADTFWRSNVLSVKSLRKNFNSLKLKSLEAKPGAKNDGIYAELGLPEPSAALRRGYEERWDEKGAIRAVFRELGDQKLRFSTPDYALSVFTRAYRDICVRIKRGENVSPKEHKQELVDDNRFAEFFSPKPGAGEVGVNA